MAHMKAMMVALVCFAFVPTPVAHATDDDAKAAADRLLDHLGGRGVWAAAHGAYIYEVHVSKWARLPYTHQVWVDFDQPRVMVRVENQDLRQLRGLNGPNDGWWIQEGEIAPYTPEFLADEHKRWVASPYRLLHLAATQDPAVGYALVGSTLILSLDGVEVLKFELDEEGRPTAFSRFNNDFASNAALGRLEAYGDVSLWRSAGTPDGNFVSHNLKFQLLPGGPGISFEPPADLNNIER